MKTIDGTVIIGGGLCGLTLAYLLEEKGAEYLLLEANNRFGGRILTLNNNEDNAPMEMGATWYGKKHRHLVAFLEKMNLHGFEQLLGKSAIYEPISTSPPQVVQLPQNEDPSYRIAGGSGQMITALEKQINAKKIHKHEPVEKIIFHKDKVELHSKKVRYYCDKVVSTLPPYLFLKTIKTDPSLPNDITKIINKTHTWMGESIKVGLRYKVPFWRDKGMSGTIFSNVGPIPEMYDHSNKEDNNFALVGFFNGNYYTLSKKERKDMVLLQLEKYYGEKVYDYLDYEEKVWAQEPYTYIPYENHVLPHENNGNSLLRKSYMNGRLLLAGTETATSFPGYMDGAIESAYRAFKLLTQ
jgi:monoamine oxidase